MGLENLNVECIVGVEPHERLARQPLSIDVVLAPHVQHWDGKTTLQQTLDYVLIQQQIEFLCLHGHFQLLEHVAVALRDVLLLRPPAEQEQQAVQAVEICLRKAQALPGDTIALVKGYNIQLRGDATHDGVMPASHTKDKTRPWRIDSVFGSRRCGIERWRVSPGQPIERCRSHAVEMLLPLSDGWEHAGRSVAVGVPLQLPANQAWQLTYRGKSQGAALWLGRQHG